MRLYNDIRQNPIFKKEILSFFKFNKIKPSLNFSHKNFSIPNLKIRISDTLQAYVIRQFEHFGVLNYM